MTTGRLNSYSCPVVFNVCYENGGLQSLCDSLLNNVDDNNAGGHNADGHNAGACAAGHYLAPISLSSRSACPHLSIM